MSEPLVFHGYWRSGTSYRTRIALNIKRVGYEQRPVDLRAGAQRSGEFRALNPQGLVPALETPDGVLTQSSAILEWLEERYPEPPLLPAAPGERAVVRAMAMAVACDIHPLNNLRVLKYLKGEMGQQQEAIDRWYAHWVREGLSALEAMAAPKAGKFLVGDVPTGADVCLVPQLYNARRFNVPIDDFPTLLRAEENANNLEAFAAARPDRQEVPA